MKEYPYCMNIFSITIPYFYNKKMQFNLFKRYRQEKIEVVLGIWKYHKLTYILGYEDDWGSSWNTFITLLKFKNNN